MQIFEAENCLSKVWFQRDEDWDLYPKSEYRCPNCNELLLFCLKDLDKHSQLRHSNRSKEDFKQFNMAGNKGCSSFLDFYCPSCKSATKIYYQAWAGGRFTDGYELKFVGLLKKNVV